MLLVLSAVFQDEEQLHFHEVSLIAFLFAFNDH